MFSGIKTRIKELKQGLLVHFSRHTVKTFGSLKISA